MPARMVLSLFFLLVCGSITLAWEEAIELGSRRELFVDRYLIASMEGAELKLNQLELAERSGQPALDGHYATVLRDGDKFRQYCRGDKVAGLHWRTDGWEAYHAAELTLLAESDDGIHWMLPKLGLYHIPRYPQGNVVLADHFLVTHNFTPMIDTCPGVPDEERYKAIGGGAFRERNAHLRPKYGAGGLYAYQSANGTDWSKLQDQPIIPESWGSFDSQNVAFYSPAEGQYVCYFRTSDKGFRAVNRSTSRDFRHWSPPVLMGGRLEKEHLYTNATHPYFRAPHIYIAPATWFLPGEDPNTRIILMTTRAGSPSYDRTFGQQEFLPNAKGGNRTNYIAWTNGAQTGPEELSFYSLGTRYTLRLDRFGSLHANSIANVVTRPLTFAGEHLFLNFATRPSGSVRVEVRDKEGTPLEGFTLPQCQPLTGDSIEQPVRWTSDAKLSQLGGQPVTLHLVLDRADVYALRFGSERQ